MRISKGHYAFLTLPWRVRDAILGPSKIAAPCYGRWVTTCEVWRLRLVYPIAWPCVIVLSVLLLCLAVVIAVVYPVAKLDEWVKARLEKYKERTCTRVTWDDATKEGDE